MRLGISRRLRHPFLPALKVTPAAAARDAAVALCGGFEELCGASERGVRVERAVFPHLPAIHPHLTESQRNRLWDLFEVPIYVLLLDSHGKLVAYECEAQRGFHLVEGCRPAVPFAVVESATCECGRAGLRLIPRAESEAAESVEALLAG